MSSLIIQVVELLLPQMRNEKRAPACLGFIWNEILPSYVGLIINHYKDPYIKSTSISMGSIRDPVFFKSKWLTCVSNVQKILVRQGVFWMGYRDCGRWFSRTPNINESCCGKSRKAGGSFETCGRMSRQNGSGWINGEVGSVGCYNPNILTMYK